jgi:hypothetical protein
VAQSIRPVSPPPEVRELRGDGVDLMGQPCAGYGDGAAGPDESGDDGELEIVGAVVDVGVDRHDGVELAVGERQLSGIDT